MVHMRMFKKSRLTTQVNPLEAMFGWPTFMSG
jgi:hypothetical protein